MNFLQKLRGLQSEKCPTMKDKEKQKRFENIIRTVNRELEFVETDIQKGMFIDYVIKIVGEELAWNVASRLIYYAKTPENATYTIPAPMDAYVGKENLSLSALNVVIDTYDFDKLKGAIPSVNMRGFRQEMNNYTGTLYPEIKLAVIENGRHHLAVAVTQNAGSAKLQICSLEKLFPTLRTDGAYWYSSNSAPDEVYDYRIAVLYELARMKHELHIPNEINLKELELPVIDHYDPILLRNEAFFRANILELEVKIRKYQLQLLQGEQRIDEIVPEIKKVEKSLAELKEQFQEWVNTINLNY